MWNDEPVFRQGDLVVQKDGGPVMTVVEVYAPIFKYRYRCSWAGADGTAEHELFRVEQLVLVRRAATPPET